MTLGLHCQFAQPFLHRAVVRVPELASDFGKVGLAARDEYYDLAVLLVDHAHEVAKHNLIDDVALGADDRRYVV